MSRYIDVYDLVERVPGVDCAEGDPIPAHWQEVPIDHWFWEPRAEGVVAECIPCGRDEAGHPVLRLMATPMSLETARANATNRLHCAVASVLAPITSRYPDWEVASWSEQLTEAQAWTGDPAAVTPLLDALRGDRDMVALCDSIIAKANAYKATSGAVFAWRHACSTWIEACTDAAALAQWRPRFPDVPISS